MHVVAPGTVALLLELRSSGVLEIDVIGEGGVRPRTAWVTVMAVSSPAGGAEHGTSGKRTTGARDGRAEVRGLEPGTYNIVVWTAGGAFGAETARVGAGSSGERVTVHLRAGSQLRIRCDRRRSFEIVVGDAVVGEGVVAAGEEAVRTVPAGEVRVRSIAEEGGDVLEEVVLCEPGGTTTVVF